ncbi:MAG TPA: hypothetical protein VKB52_04205 [Rhodanobacteraceae bacterium]|nr:hypothetical protein [Rhodanobacteraceae bacterium]
MKRSVAVLAVGAPLALAVLEVFHPHVQDFFALDLDRWLLVHYLQIPLFTLAALAMALVAGPARTMAAAISRVSMLVFVMAYVPFDTAAGVVTGELAKAGLAAGSPDAWRAPIQAIWAHPLLGGSPDTAPVFAIVGTMAWLVGAVATAVAVRRAGSSWGPVVLLGVSGLGLFVFRTHAWPGGPVSFGALAAAAAWVAWEQRNAA